MNIDDKETRQTMSDRTRRRCDDFTKTISWSLEGQHSIESLKRNDRDNETCQIQIEP